MNIDKDILGQDVYDDLRDIASELFQTIWDDSDRIWVGGWPMRPRKMVFFNVIFQIYEFSDEY